MKPLIPVILIVALLIAFTTLRCTGPSDLSAVNLTCNYAEQPLGIDSSEPALGWQLSSSGKEIIQVAYQIIVNEGEASGEKVWDSGKVKSGQSINILYKGNRLKSGKRYSWKVKIWDNRGNESSWSESTWFQTGLFAQEDWHGARWIAYELLDPAMTVVPGIHGSGNNLGEKALYRPVVPQFRKLFKIEKEIQSAILSISGLGHYEAYINGQKTGNSFLAPGWTDYEKTILYNTYDITQSLKKGLNVVGALVGNGFCNINRERYRKLVITYGYPKLLAHININYSDGSTDIIVSDETWKTTPSPITYTSIYGGEDYDATRELKGWTNSEYIDTGWEQVTVTEAPPGKLKAENDYPLMEMETFEVLNIIPLGDTAWLYDFGQNASGIIELTVTGEKGQEIKLWPGELINTDLTINQRASGGPYYFSYILNGGKDETWKPKFTYYGFRYVQVSGAVPAGENNPAGLPEIKNLSFIHTRNSSPENGTFACDNHLMNQIHSLIDWAIRSNYQSVVTDCPHREKLGWLEQTHLMGQGIHFRYANYHLYQKLVYDMIDSQAEDGLVPDIAPEYVEFVGGFRDSPEWGSAAVFLPYLVWKWYGDKQVMDDAWEMMKRYIDYLKNKSNNHILDHGLGDWFDLGPENPGVSQLTPISLTATAFYYYDIKLMAEMAALLDKPEKDELNHWAEEVRIAFNKKFFDEDSLVYSTGSQTAMAIPYCMDIVDEQFKFDVFENLADSIIAGNKALTAGDIGFHYVVEALTKGEAAQLMFDMINRDDVPGYGYQLKKGATALTESWAALEIVSNNHLMLGHVMEWFYSGLAGIGQSENSCAYKNITIEPQLVSGIHEVTSHLNSPYGVIRSEWEIKDSTFHIEVEIPHNTTATIYLPTYNKSSVLVEGKDFQKIDLRTSAKNKIQIELGSGIYRLQSGTDFFNI